MKEKGKRVCNDWGTKLTTFLTLTLWPPLQCIKGTIYSWQN